MKYFVYCRKSTESEDRQVLSITSQRNELAAAFPSGPEIDIREVLEESASAKGPGRPVFNDMIRRLEKGEAEGIIAWHPDRLARNSIDGGRVIYLLDTGRLKDLKFATFTFENSSQGKFMLSILFGYSKYYVDTLSENIKRGNRTKIQLGWRPGWAPLGYLNDQATKTIIPDPVRYPLVRRMWELALSGAYTPRRIWEIATTEWGLRTLERRRTGGGPLALSAVYTLLSNPFYAGVFEWAGNTYPGKHLAMITLAEFDDVQKILGTRGRPRPQKHRFPFTGLIRCGSCGLAITAEEQVNRYGTRYTYYHCSKPRRIGAPRCREPYLRAEDLADQLAAFLGTLAVHPFIVSWAEDSASPSKRIAVIEAERQALVAARSDVDRQLTTLTDLRVRSLLSDAEYVTRRQTLERDRLRLVERDEMVHTTIALFEPLQILVSFSNHAPEWFRTGVDLEKRLIIEAACSNPTIGSRILSVSAALPFIERDTVAHFPDQRWGVEDVRTFLNDAGVRRRIAALENLSQLRAERGATEGHLKDTGSSGKVVLA